MQTAGRKTHTYKVNINTGSSSSSSLIVSRTRLLTVGDRAFPVAAARVSNSLPDLVTSAPSVAVFRSRLKTHLFNISYPCDCIVPAQWLVALDTERGQVALSKPLSEVLRPKFGLRPDLSQNLTWRRRFGLRIFLDQIWVLALLFAKTGLESRNLLRPNLTELGGDLLEITNEKR